MKGKNSINSLTHTLFFIHRASNCDFGRSRYVHWCWIHNQFDMYSKASSWATAWNDMDTQWIGEFLPHTICLYKKSSLLFLHLNRKSITIHLEVRVFYFSFLFYLISLPYLHTKYLVMILLIKERKIIQKIHKNIIKWDLEYEKINFSL